MGRQERADAAEARIAARERAAAADAVRWGQLARLCGLAPFRFLRPPSSTRFSADLHDLPTLELFQPFPFNSVGRPRRARGRSLF